MYLIVLHPFAVEQLKDGEEIGAGRSELLRRLQRAGEDRFPYIRYATTAELAAHADSEP